ncbi:NTP transferase domain-containing protein [Streptomyces sp. NPDC102347]|uniref:NTP transferase domain-containing protein n=1 Tax=Streptomyces sp. NPDC102347 TaxID=3366157 RepID=UPI003813DB70
MTENQPSPAPAGGAPGDASGGFPEGPAAYDAVVLAGGASRRLGGTDKPAVRVGGRPLLDRVLAACADARTTVVVADPRPTTRPVVWAREDPPGGGPLAALDAGLRHLTAEHVVLLSADLPFLDRRTVGALLASLRRGAADGVLLTDSDGREQPLVAAYRTGALRRELAALTARHGGPAGLPLRRLTGALDLLRISDPVASFDCDTWDDIATARARIREHGHVLDEWISAVKDELGIDLDVDTGLLLDLARDAAHGVARPAAPLTTFLVGFAAAQGSGDRDAVAEAVRKAVALAGRWAEEDTPEAAPSATPSADADGAAAESGGTAPGAAPGTRPDAG